MPKQYCQKIFLKSQNIKTNLMGKLILFLSIILLSSFTNVVTFNKVITWDSNNQTETIKTTTFSINLSEMELEDTLYIGESKFQYYRKDNIEVVVCDYIVFSLTIREGDSGVTYIK